MAGPTSAGAPRRLDIGLTLPTRLGAAGLGLTQVLGIAEAADSTPRWGRIWAADSVISLPFYDSVVLLSACAARTQRVGLGVACQASLGLRHPLIVAQQWANLDQLSGGRMTMVACPGEATGPTREKELAAFSMDHREKTARMEENVAFLRAASTGGTFSFSGRYFSVKELDPAPEFVQHPLPIWMAGNPPAGAEPRAVDRVLDRVARLGDGWLTSGVEPDVLAVRVEQLNERRRELGRDTDRTFPVHVFLNVNVQRQESAALDDALAAWPHHATRHVSVDRLRQFSAIGTPEQAAQAVGRFVEAGATGIVIGLLSKHRREQLERIAEHLLPLIA